MNSRERIIHYCQRMDAKGWVANHDGNITVREGDGFLATPSGRAKADLTAADLLTLDAQGKKTAGTGSIFSEYAVHARIYAVRSEVQAVVHAHPVAATAVGCAHQEMLTSAIPEAVVSLGPGVPVAGLALPNSESLWQELDPLLAHYDAVMVAGNGVFAWGTSLEQAFLRLELVEHLARILLDTMAFGGPKLLDSHQVAALLKKREQAGLALPPDPARALWFPSA